MSPAAKLLRCHREARGWNQQTASEKLGYEQSFISAIEGGHKPFPRKNFTEKVIRVFELTAEEADKFESAVMRSRRSLMLPASLDTNRFELAHNFIERLETLSLKEMEVIKVALTQY